MVETMIWFYLMVAMACDLKSYRIPNELIVIGYISVLTYQIYIQGIEGIVVFLGASLTMIVILYPLFLLKALGSGDIKLFSVIVPVVGVQCGLLMVFISLVLGGLVGLVRVIRRKNIFVMSYMHFSICIAGAFLITNTWR